MFKLPQLQTTNSFLENAKLYDGNVPMIPTNGVELKKEQLQSQKIHSSFTGIAEASKAQSQNSFERISSPNLELNMDFSSSLYRQLHSNAKNSDSGKWKASDQNYQKQRSNDQQFLESEALKNSRPSRCILNQQRKNLVGVHIQLQETLQPQKPYINENRGYRTQQQTFQSQPFRERFDNNSYAPYRNAPYHPRPYRPWMPRTTNNFNFVNLPFSPQHHGYQHQIQQAIDYTQSVAQMAALINYAKNNKQRIVPVQDDIENGEIAVVFEGPPIDPKPVISKRKRNSSINASNSSLNSEESVTSDTSSNTPSQNSSKQSENFERLLQPAPSTVNLPQMTSLKSDTVINLRNYELEDGEILDDDCIDNSAAISEAPLSRHCKIIAKEQSSLPAECINNSVASTYDPSHPLFNPLLDEEDLIISNVEGIALDDSIDLDIDEDGN